MALSRKPVGLSGIQLYQGRYFRNDPNEDLTNERAYGDQSRFGVFEKMRLTDPGLAAAMRVVKTPLLSGWKLRQADASDEVFEFVRDALFNGRYAGFSWPSFVWQALLALDMGHVFFEPTYKLGTYKDGSQKLFIRRLYHRLPKTIEDYNVIDEDLVSLKQRGVKNGTQASPTLRADQILFFSWEQIADNYQGTSTYRQLFGLYLLRDILQRSAIIASERAALGLPVAKEPEDSLDEDDRGALEETLQHMRLHEQAFVVLPHGAELEWISGGHELLGAYRELMAGIDRQIMAVYGAQFMTLGEGASGSRAVGDVQLEYFQQFLESIAVWFEAVVNGTFDTPHTGLIPRIVRHNFGDGVEYPVLDHESLRQDNLTEAANQLSTLLQSDAVTKDASIEEHTRERFKLPEMGEVADDSIEEEIEPEPMPEEPEPDPDIDAEPEMMGLQEPIPAQNLPQPRLGGQRPPKADPEKAEIKGPNGRPLTDIEQSVAWRETEAVLDQAQADVRQAVGAAQREMARVMAEEAAEIMRQAETTAEMTERIAELRPPASVREGLTADLSEILGELRERGADHVDRERKRQARGAAKKRALSGFGRWRARRKVAALLRELRGQLMARSLMLATPGDPVPPGQLELDDYIQAQAGAQGSKLEGAMQGLVLQTAIDAIPAGVTPDELVRRINEAAAASTIVGKDAGWAVVSQVFSQAREERVADLVSKVGEAPSVGVYSAVLDANTCENCAADDGTRIQWGSALHAALMPPNRKCLGGTRCRCVIVWDWR